MKPIRTVLAACGALILGANAIAATTLAAPANVAATTNDTEGIRVTWGKVTDAAYYVVYRYGGKTAQTGLVAETVTDTTWYDTTCAAGVEIPYRVQAFNAKGGASAFSAYVRGYRVPTLDAHVGGDLSANPLGAGAGRPFKVKCNVNWTVTATDWILLHQASFKGGSEVQELAFDLAENTTGEMRRGTVVVHAGQLTQQMTVWQGAVPVAGQGEWNGDSALAIVEDAACGDDFRFGGEPAHFLTHYDAGAVGGSCLRTMPMTMGQRAFLAWRVPSDRTVTFRWRKDTSNANDSFCVYEGTVTQTGDPDLKTAKLLAKCASTDWTTVTIPQNVNAQPCIFFIFEKKSGCTVSSLQGFGYLDGISLETLPEELAFLEPVTGNSGAYTLKIGDSDEASVLTEVIESHTVTYGGETHQLRKRVSPKWQWVGGQNNLVGVHVGEGPDGGDLFFVQGRPTEAATSVWRASYTVGGVTVSQDLTVSATPKVSEALDCGLLTGGQWNGWTHVAEPSAVGSSAAASGVPDPSRARKLVASFNGTGILRFSYRIDQLADDESATFGIGDTVCGTLAETDGEWFEASVMVVEDGEHTVFWNFAKEADGLTPGSGLLVDHVRIEKIPTSVAVAGLAAGDTIPYAFADCAYSSGGCTLTALDGDWIDGSATVRRSDGVYSIAFEAEQNATGALRSNRLRLVCGATTNVIRVLQSTTGKVELSTVWLYPMSQTHLSGGESQQFSVSLDLGGPYTEDFTALDWSHTFGEAATMVDGLLTAGVVTNVLHGFVETEVLGKGASSPVTLHPAARVMAPDGVTLAAENWRVESDNGVTMASGGEMFLQSHIEDNPWASAPLTATMTGPGVFTCQVKVSSVAEIDKLTVSMDGEAVRVLSGTDGDWTDIALPIPEGEHEVAFVYSKEGAGSAGDDSGFVRRLGFIPCTLTDEVRLSGRTALTSGTIASYKLLRVCTNEEQGVGMEAAVWLDEKNAAVTLTATDSRTTAAVTTTFENGAVRVSVPFAVEWADTLTLGVMVENGDTPLAAAMGIPVTPVSLKQVLDVGSNPALSGFGTGEYSYGDIEVVEDSTAATANCVRMTTTGYGTWSNGSKLKLTVMDAGTLSFKYKLKNGAPPVDYGDYSAGFRVYVDDMWSSVESYWASDTPAWATGSVTINSDGPHVVMFEFLASSKKTELSEGLLDQLSWASKTPGMSQVVGGQLNGPDRLLTSENMSEIVYLVNLKNTEGTPYAAHLAPQYHTVEIVGDEDRVSYSTYENKFYVYAEEEVSVDTVVTIKAFNTVFDVNADAEWTITVAARAPVDKAIFDVGWFDNCWMEEDGAYKGWTGKVGDAAVGESSARTVALADDEGAEMYVVAYGAGTLEFDWKVSSAAGDELSFSADPVEGEPVASISGVGAGWQHVTVTFATAVDKTGGNPLRRLFRWAYQKNGDGRTAGEDCAWVDNVVWNSSSPAEIDYANVNIPWSLTPGSVAVGTLEFYRKRNWRKQREQEKQQQGWESPQPATEAPLPTVAWRVYEHQPEALTNDVAYYIDGAGNLVVSLAEGCKETGSFGIDASYDLGYGTQTESRTVNVEQGSAYYMSNAKTAGGVPYAWLAQQGQPGLTMSALEASERKIAANGVNTLRECYVAGLDATDTNAAFVATVTMTNGMPYISWTPNKPGRTYVIKGKASLADPEWVAPTNSTHRFFKVEIDWNK